MLVPRFNKIPTLFHLQVYPLLYDFANRIIKQLSCETNSKATPTKNYERTSANSWKNAATPSFPETDERAPSVRCLRLMMRMRRKNLKKKMDFIFVVFFVV